MLGFAVQALLAYGLAVLALPWLLSLVTGLQSGGLFGRLVDSTGCSSRKILWSNVLTLIMQKPWLGWGWGELVALTQIGIGFTRLRLVDQRA